jgi:hypothetical protein
MSEHKEEPGTTAEQRSSGPPEAEHYEEPPRMAIRDTIGVVVALVLLAVIGVAGYVWLTPGLSFSDLFPAGGTSAHEVEAGSPPAAIPAPGATSTGDAEAVAGEGAVDSEHGDHVSATAIDSRAGDDAPVAGSAQAGAEAGGVAPGEDAAVMTDDASQQAQAALGVDLTAEARCAYCGMFAHKSESRIVAQWVDGSVTQHDCWDCAFSYGTEEGLGFEGAQVAAYGGSLAEPRMLDAAEAWYLYDTRQIKGSMPPYVAAFDSRAAAEAAQPGLGGGVVDFAGLQRMWE